MKQAKFFSILLILGFVLGMVAGCAQTPTSNPAPAAAQATPAVTAPTAVPATAPAVAAPTAVPTAAPVAAATPTEITMWSFIQQHLDYFVSMSAKWNELHPDKPVKIVPVFYDWASLHDKLYAAQIAGQGIPDIADVEMGKWQMFMNGDIQFLDLTSYIQPYAKDLITPILDMVSKDGKLYAAPSHVGATVMYYNTELLDKAGIDYKTIVTWDDFEKALKTYKDKTGNYRHTEKEMDIR
jgi:arabinosaccharide transport system substrate-binding protein